MKISGNIVDVIKKEIYSGILHVKKDRIIKIERTEKKFRNFILPGLVDAHLHIESSMLAPAGFAEIALPHGTAGVVADPHEIANVSGLQGINFMIKEAKKVPLKFFFAAPSCVPATEFETSGAKIGIREIKKLMKMKDIVALGEIMNYPAIISEDEEIMKKIKIAKKFKKPIDGHCPRVSGENLKKYISAGITTDHESVSLKEAREKALLGMKIMIREGTTAKNMEGLANLAKSGKYECFLVSDDIHPDDLIKGHIDLLLKKIISNNVEPLEAIRMVTLYPIRHYNLGMGLLQKGDKADFIEVNNLKDFKVLKVWINGVLRAKNGRALFKAKSPRIETSFEISNKKLEDFIIYSKSDVFVRVIETIKNQIITKEKIIRLKVKNGKLEADPESDVLKIAVCDRYGKGNVGLGFIKGFGITDGAIASSVAHDSHNIVAVGTNDSDISKAVNLVTQKGGMAVVYGNEKAVLELPIAGLMTHESARKVILKMKKLERLYRKAGGKASNPFTLLSFMSLLVIPDLKLSDKGLFDVNKFKFVDLAVGNRR